MNQPQQDSSAPPASKCCFHCVLKDPDFAKAIAAVTEALKAQGLGILTEIDFRS